MAELADKHQLYMQAVQTPRNEVRNIDVIYRTLSTRYQNCISKTEANVRRYALMLREDFCGTAVLCAEWVRTRSTAGRLAFGIDIDPDVIEYARNNVLCTIDDPSKIRLVCGDVIEVGSNDTESEDNIPHVEIIVAFNFA
ncbi:hypothetical protein IWW41_001280, partial [Coemansia sp. RSA 2522]